MSKPRGADKTAANRIAKQWRERAKNSLFDEGVKLLSSLHDIPDTARGQLSAQFYPEMNVAQVWYRKHLEGTSIPNIEASHERGKIYDMRTGRAICGGSSYTHLAVAKGNQLEIVDGEIILDEIDKDGNFTGKTFHAPLPRKSSREVAPHKLDIDSILAKVEEINLEIRLVSEARNATMEALNAQPDEALLKQRLDEQILLLASKTNEVVKLITLLNESINISTANIFARYKVLASNLISARIINKDVELAEKSLVAFEQYLQSMLLDPETLEFEAAQDNKHAKHILSHLDTYNQLRTEYPSLTTFISEYISLVDLWKKERRDSEQAARYKNLYPKLGKEFEEDIKEKKLSSYEISRKIYVFHGNIFLLFPEFVYDDAVELFQDKKESVSGNNLAIERAVSEDSSIIRYYAEGTHVYIYKFNGEVLMATHKNARAGYYNDNGDFVGTSKYGGISFATMYNRVGGPEPKSLFPETCLTSPYVFRFLICTRHNSFSTRKLINERGYLVFVGVQKMWNYGDDCPYETGWHEPSSHRYSVSQRKPFAGTKDERTEEELLNIELLTSLSVSTSYSTDCSVDPFVYFPKFSVDLTEANRLLSQGLYCSDTEPPSDIRLGDGESIMISYFETINGKRYIRNIRVMSESLYFRYNIHRNTVDINSLIKYSVKAEDPDYVSRDAPVIKAYTIDDYLASFTVPYVSKNIINMISSLEEITVDDLLLSFGMTEIPAFYRRLIAVTIYIWSANPSKHMYLVKDFLTFYENIQELTMWMTNDIMRNIDRPAGDSETSKFLSKTLTHIKQEIIQYFSKDLNDDDYDKIFGFVWCYVHQFSFLQVDNLINYMLTTFPTRDEAISFFQKELKPFLKADSVYKFKERTLAEGGEKKKGTMSVAKLAKMGSGGKKCFVKKGKK